MKTLIFGAGGHGKVVFDILKAQGVSVDGFVDSRPRVPELFGVPVLPESILIDSGPLRMVVAVGANHIRRDVVNRVLATCPQVEFFNAVHPTAYVSVLSRLGVGNVIAAGALVTPDVVIGDHAVINTGAQVDHDCEVGNFVTVAPGAVLGGTVRVGEGTYVAIGASVRHGITIGDWSVLGAGAVVVENIPDRVVAFGSPCRVVRTRNENDPYL